MDIQQVLNSPLLVKATIALIIILVFALAQLTRRGKKCRTLKGEWVKSKAEKKDCGLSLHAQHQLQVRTNANWITAGLLSAGAWSLY